MVFAAEELADFWANLTTERVFRTDIPFLARNLLHWATRLASGGSLLAPEVRGLVDTAPLVDLLSGALRAASDGPVPGIQRNLEAGKLKAVSLTTLDYATGRTVAWVQGCGIRNWERPNRVSVKTRLGIDHVMASSALPLFFPATHLAGSWHGDGGMRLSAPLSPAIHLGARRVLAVSTRYRGAPEEPLETIRAYPSPAHILGRLFNSIFLDSLDEDVERAQRLNRLSSLLPAERKDELRRVDVLVLRPSEDLGRLAGQFEIRLPRGFRFLTRGLGTRETATPDFLSLLLFQPDYLRALIDIGEADGERRMSEIEALVDPGSVPAPSGGVTGFAPDSAMKARPGATG
jgi:NTE family protein